MQSLIDRMQKFEDSKKVFKFTNPQLINEYSKFTNELLSEIDKLSSKNYTEILVRGTVYQVKTTDYVFARDKYKDDREALKNCIAFEIGVPVSVLYLE